MSDKNQNGIEIDEMKVKNMLRRLIVLERNNLQTKALNDQQMVNKIKKMIEEEVKCY